MKNMEFNFGGVFGDGPVAKMERDFKIFINKEVRRWLEDKAVFFASSTKDPKNFAIRRYLLRLQMFCDFHECNNPSDLVREPIDTRNRRLAAFLAHLRKQSRYTEASIDNNFASVIKSFYAARGAPISLTVSTRQHGENKNVVTLSRDLLARVVCRLSARNRVFVKFLASTGLRVNDALKTLTSSKGGGARYAFEPHGRHYFVRDFQTQKNGIVIPYLFVTSEVARDLASLHRAADPAAIDLRTLWRTNRGSLLDCRTAIVQCQRVMRAVGESGRFRLHSCRKYFRTAVRRSPINDEAFYESLMTHSQGVRGVYIQDLSDIDEFYAKWLKIEPYLFIEADPTPLLDNSVINDVMAKNGALEKKVADMQIQILAAFNAILGPKTIDIAGADRPDGAPDPEALRLIAMIRGEILNKERT